MLGGNVTVERTADLRNTSADHWGGGTPDKCLKDSSRNLSGVLPPAESLVPASAPSADYHGLPDGKRGRTRTSSMIETVPFTIRTSHDRIQ